MPSLLIRSIDDSTKTQLRLRAAQHHRSMEEEAREILKVALAGQPRSGTDFARSIHQRFAALGGAELEIPPRESIREPPDFR